MYRNKLYYW